MKGYDTLQVGNGPTAPPPYSNFERGSAGFIPLQVTGNSYPLPQAQTTIHIPTVVPAPRQRSCFCCCCSCPMWVCLTIIILFLIILDPINIEKIKVVLIFILSSLIGHECLLSIEGQEVSKDLRESYKVINHHLFDNVKSESLESNMREAVRWFNEEVSQSSDKNLEEALKLFISMENMQMCSRESIDILEANDIFTDNVAKSENKSESTRITDIIAHYAREHAEKCIPVYSKNLQNKYRRVGESTIKKVKTLATRLQLVPFDLGFRNMLKRGIEYDFCGTFIRDGIVIMAKDDPDKEYLGKVSDRTDGSTKLNEVKLRELYDRYVIAPCEQFVTMNDDGWLDLFIFDEQWKGGDASENSLLEFRNSYKICNHLIGEKTEQIYNLFKADANRH